MDIYDLKIPLLLIMLVVSTILFVKYIPQDDGYKNYDEIVINNETIDCYNGNQLVVSYTFSSVKIKHEDGYAKIDLRGITAPGINKTQIKCKESRLTINNEKVAVGL